MHYFFFHNSVGIITGKCRNKIYIPFHKYLFELCVYFHNGIFYFFPPIFLISKSMVAVFLVGTARDQ